MSAESTRIRLADGVETDVKSDLLKHNSGYFSSLFRAHTGVVELIEVKSDCFLVLKKWMEGGNVTDHPSWKNIYDIDSDRIQGTNQLVVVKDSVIKSKGPLSSIDVLIDSWIMGDYLLAPAFQNFVMDHISLCYGYMTSVFGFPVYNLKHIFENTTENSKLRQFIVQASFASFTPKSLMAANELGLIPDEMFLALACIGLQRLPPQQPWKDPREEWYVEIVDWKAEHASRNR